MAAVNLYDDARQVSLEDAQAMLAELVHSVVSDHRPVLITTSDSTTAVLVSVAYLEGYEETIEILRDRDLMDDLREAQAEIARGEVISAEQVRAAFERRRAQRGIET